MRYTLVIIGALCLACGASPEADDASAYVAAMQAPIRDNAALAQRFLTSASMVKKHGTDGPRLAEELALDLVPQADALAKAVGAVDPESPSLDEAHALIVKAWVDRAAAYGAMRDAWTSGDLNAWDAAAKKNWESKLDEERYFSEVNRYLAEYELRLEQYPE